MHALRIAHVRARSDATFAEPDPRPEMMRLAEEFPGSLREIDTLPLDVIATRIEALARAEHNVSRVEEWMAAQSIFHRLARGALVTKRWLGGRKRITVATRSAFVEALASLPRSSDAELFADDLHLIATPPRGRLMDIVHAKVAELLGVTDDHARKLVFGERRRRK